MLAIIAWFDLDTLWTLGRADYARGLGIHSAHMFVEPIQRSDASLAADVEKRYIKLDIIVQQVVMEAHFHIACLWYKTLRF